MRDKLVGKKPVSQMSEKEKEECRLVAELIAEAYLDKHTIADFLGLDERIVRDRVAKIAQRRPVIASSGKKGYKLAQGVEDVYLAKQTIAESKSRIREIKKRIRPLEKFVEEYDDTYEQSR